MLPKMNAMNPKPSSIFDFFRQAEVVPGVFRLRAVGYSASAVLRMTCAVLKAVECRMSKSRKHALPPFNVYVLAFIHFCIF